MKCIDILLVKEMSRRGGGSSFRVRSTNALPILRIADFGRRSRVKYLVHGSKLARGGASRPGHWRRVPCLSSGDILHQRGQLGANAAGITPRGDELAIVLSATGLIHARQNFDHVEKTVPERRFPKILHQVLVTRDISGAPYPDVGHAGRVKFQIEKVE